MSTSSHRVTLSPVQVGARRHDERPGHVRGYLAPYLGWLRVSDLLSVAVAVLIAQVVRFDLGASSSAQAHLVGEISYATVSSVLVLAWMGMLQLLDSYDGRLVGHGVQEYRQVFSASVWLFSVLAIASYALKVDFARGYVLIAFPLGTVLLLLGRWAARRWLVAQRVQGQLSDRVLLVGDQEHVDALVKEFRRTPSAGFHVVGACINDTQERDVSGVPVVGRVREAQVRALNLGADVIAVSSSAGLGARGLRRLGWSLEGTNIDLVVAPGIMDVAGPRVLTRPVQGLPLIHVESPKFSGPHLVLKNILDRLGALALIICLAPVLGGLAVAVRASDGGPALFRQHRVGRNGGSFGMLKFRSMVVDAEAQLPELAELNEGAGPLFKLRQDNRITKIGRVLRRYSLDELPQLVNVLRGEMSLVGPRPPLPCEVAEYEPDTRRRLLVKPGMTGMWQIGGRSNLSWEESKRLDLYYVENWTPLLDLMIMWRTAMVVLRPDSNGAC